MALATYRIDGGRIAEPRVAVGGAEPHARRIGEAEQTLAGKPPGADVFAAAAERAAAAVDPMEDVHNNAQYRRDLVRAMVRRALDQAAARDAA
jgi:carbon-monoxide dehydrogenase medium subunit